MIVAGIVTHEPDMERFRQNLAAIATQVHGVIVFDNGSSNIDAVADHVLAVPPAQLIASDENLGIASALNRIADRSVALGATWIVTLDQDSVAPDGMVAELADVARDHPEAAIVAPYIVDRNKLSVEQYRALDLPRVEHFTQAARRGAITSGALTSVRALTEVGGFDDRLFIDYVDYDLNQRVLLSGRKILRANRTFLLHEVGHAQKTWLWVPRKDMSGKWRLERFYSFGHSSARCYYKARNRVLFTRKYWRNVALAHEGANQLPQQIALTILFENDRAAKLRAFARGMRDGMRMSVN